MKEGGRKVDSMVGLAVVGVSLTGFISFVAGIVGLFSGQLAAGGSCLIASALAFGLLANALLRN